MELPRPMGQGTDRAQVVDVARQLTVDILLKIGGDLGVLAAGDHADVRHPGHFGDEADAAGALDAAGHECLDRRPHVLFFDRALVLRIAGAVAAIAHGLILQVALAALVADRAVQRVVDEQELHHPFAGLLDHRRVGEDLLPLGSRKGTRGLRLRRSGLHLDQAHAAVAGDRQPLVIAEARNLLSGAFGDLEHGHTGLELDFYAVDFSDRHQRASCSTASAAVGTLTVTDWPLRNRSAPASSIRHSKLNTPPSTGAAQDTVARAAPCDSYRTEAPA